MPIRISDYQNAPSKLSGQLRSMKGSESFQVGVYQQQIQSLTVTAVLDASAGFVVTDSVGNVSSFSVTGSAIDVAATGTITGSVGVLDFEADTSGDSGNLIQVILADTATAGSETISVVGSVITVGIESGVSTAAQIKAAIDADVDAAALVDTVATTAGAMESDSVTLSGGDYFSAVDMRDALLAVIQADKGFSALVKSEAAATSDIKLTVLNKGQDVVISSLVGAGSLSEDQASSSGSNLPVGRAVVRNSSDSQVMELPGAGSVSADLLGVTVRKHAYNVPSNNAEMIIPLGSFGEVLYQGELYVEIDDAVVAGDPVYARVANGTLGIFRNDADGGDAVLLASAKFIEAGSSGDVVAIRVNMP